MLSITLEIQRISAAKYWRFSQASMSFLVRDVQVIKNELGSSRMDTVLKMLLIAFVSLLAFSSGVYFGKQMSDSDHQLKALESDFSSQKYAAATDEAQGTDEQIEEEEVAGKI